MFKVVPFPIKQERVFFFNPSTSLPVAVAGVSLFFLIKDCDPFGDREPYDYFTM